MVQDVGSLSRDGLDCLFRRFLLEDRGLAHETVRGYSASERGFVVDVGGPGGLRGLDVVAVEGFVSRYAARTTPSTAATMTTGLRVFLRWAHQMGWVSAGLDTAVPTVAAWRLPGVPNTVTVDTIEAVLDGARRGRDPLRDVAVVLLMARLGLRSTEVTRLLLEDIDWVAGTITVRGKARRIESLPLLVDVGEALASYLCLRPTPGDGVREVFTWSVPGRALSADQVRDLTRRACRIGGVPPFGTHRLRHSLATSMLAAGVGLEGIGQVLRHRTTASTAVYAKCDLVALMKVARMWPGAVL